MTLSHFHCHLYFQYQSHQYCTLFASRARPPQPAGTAITHIDERTKKSVTRPHTSTGLTAGTSQLHHLVTSLLSSASHFFPSRLHRHEERGSYQFPACLVIVLHTDTHSAAGHRRLRCQVQFGKDRLSERRPRLFDFLPEHECCCRFIACTTVKIVEAIERCSSTIA